MRDAIIVQSKWDCSLFSEIKVFSSITNLTHLISHTYKASFISGTFHSCLLSILLLPSTLYSLFNFSYFLMKRGKMEWNILHWPPRRFLGIWYLSNYCTVENQTNLHHCLGNEVSVREKEKSIGQQSEVKEEWEDSSEFYKTSKLP